MKASHHTADRRPEQELGQRHSITRRALLTSGGIGAAALVALPVVSTYRFQVNEYTRELPALSAPLRVAQLSDLHYGPFVKGGSVREWVNAALRAEPDLILVTGDFVDHDLDGDLTPLLTELARLRAPLGVYGVWGNHDYGAFGARRVNTTGAGRASWMAHRDAFAVDLQRAGLRVLRNEGVQLRPDLYLAGVDDLWWGEPRAAQALQGARGATLLMSHNPDLLPEVPEHVALTVCGHTHGGQVRLPVVGALTTSSRYGERFAQGFVKGPALGFVSRGLGVSFLPLRLNCPPEVAVLNLQPVRIS